MRKLTFGLMFLVLVAVASGCAPQKKAMYYWDGYSKSLYEYKKSPSDETFAKHVESLQNIIKYSTENNMKVPPGVYAEMGYYMLVAKKPDEATKFFKLESQNFTESTIFMEKLIETAKQNDKPKPTKTGEAQ